MACTTGNPTPCSAGPEPGNPPGIRALLGEEYLAGATHTVLDDNPGMAPELAERIVLEAGKFVRTASLFPTARIAPTDEVDKGWHALILHTLKYAALCSSLGRTVHHYPERPDAARRDPDVITRTMALIEQAGHTPDTELWTGRVGELVGVIRHTPPGGCGPINPGKCASLPTPSE
ncbi:glycine-rich domain-containing protein [Streptomyces sp. NPDC004288]|uniref:glycine-rich domain-containing protein n=1 Tax=unclassified Streptomyces TaxID=2593676 RepID=UPI0036F9324E